MNAEPIGYLLVLRGGAATERGAAQLAQGVSGATGRAVSAAFLDRASPTLVDALDRHRGDVGSVVLVPLAFGADVPLAGWVRRVASDWAAAHLDAPALALGRPFTRDGISEGIADALATLDTVAITPRAGALSDPAWSRVPAYRHHVLVCRGPRCSARGGGAAAAALASQLRRRELTDDDVLVAQTDCLYPCNLGPMLVVNPGDTWYGRLTPQRVRQIVDEHLVGGNIVHEAAVRNAAPD